MIRADYDTGTGFLTYIGWAMPGTDGNDAGWVIAQSVVSGAQITGWLWAGTAADFLDFDKIWDNRAALSYVAVASATHAIRRSVTPTPTGSLPIATFDVGYDVEFSVHDVLLNQGMLRRVFSPASPGIGEYRLDAAGALTVGRALEASDRLEVRVYLGN